MALIENTKLYSGNDLENIFFKPMIADNAIHEQGIRVLYNMPVPTTIHLWGASGNVLKPYQAGWQGGSAAVKESKTIDLVKIKAESAFDATDYYSRVYECITTRPDVNLQDLSGTDLEMAETTIFKKAIAEGLRVATWIGNTGSSGSYDIFDGILCKVNAACEENDRKAIVFPEHIDDSTVLEALNLVWNNATDVLKSLKKDGQLAFFVSSDFYRAYEEYIYNTSLENSSQNCTEGYDTLYYRGIPLVDIGVSESLLTDNDLADGQCLLTDRRNLVLVLNTSDHPEAEVRMWYNPDQMENRQRAVFLAAADFIDFNLVALGHA